MIIWFIGMSGAGKTTISRCLLERDPNLTLSVSVTTRLKRPGEVADKDYIFIDPTEYIDKSYSEFRGRDGSIQIAVEGNRAGECIQVAKGLSCPI